jgi:hypothetical protein
MDQTLKKSVTRPTEVACTGQGLPGPVFWHDMMLCLLRPISVTRPTFAHDQTYTVWEILFLVQISKAAYQKKKHSSHLFPSRAGDRRRQSLRHSRRSFSSSPKPILLEVAPHV